MPYRSPEEQAAIDRVIKKERRRHTLRAIGKMLNLSETAVYERMRRLIRLGEMEPLEPRKWPPEREGRRKQKQDTPKK